MNQGTYIANQSNTVYKYDDSDQAYICIGKLNGQTLKEWIEDHENHELHQASEDQIESYLKKML